jgi:HK97 family phage prohead protease
MGKALERRLHLSKLEVRAEGDKSPILVGYAAVFNSESQDLGGFVEILKPGCFTETLLNGDQRALWNHCHDHLLGRTKSGTLRLAEDDHGLRFELDVPDTSLGRDVYELVKRGDVDGVSFGFYSVHDEWSADGKVNTVLEADLVEISPVVWPAYLEPKVEARSFNPDRLARRPDPKHPRLERARRIIRLDDEA